MNRAQLTEEMISLKKQLEEKAKEASLARHNSRNVMKMVIVIVLALLVVTGTYIHRSNYWESNFNDRTSKIEQLSKANKKLEGELNSLSSSGSLVYVAKEDLLNDLLNNYPDVSTKTKILILETILSESEKYNINPLILYSLVFVESSFRHWLEHSEAIINKGDKKIKIRAVGLTGVVWEWWGEKLKDAGIVETRGDLFDPVTNIKAGAFVYNQMYQMEMHKSAKYKDESALLRYFGGDYISYIQRIDAKIATFVRPNLYRKD